ncbi:putative acetyltransferase [Marmoricola endophyticus]|uniref:Acetyltransferase n=1 Tax=Marmoricola endophyticus TaxID=2040280 RepID=A0A917F7K7_9ACTN|nr:GNAT family N-acetyltransferase [Marmoricola endophyticus]GGF58070.1 putative acetyltransferase [Marmoricola endophyticus]
MDVETLTDPVAFLREAGDLLAAEPVVGTIPATVAQRLLDHPEVQRAQDWFAVVRDGGRVVGVAMRTAPFEPDPVHLLPMPEEAARALAEAVSARGEAVDAVSGDRDAVRAFAGALAAGRSVRTVEETRLWEVRSVVVPRRVSGHLRPATRDDLAVATAWYGAFAREAAEQAGHEVMHVVEPSREEMLRRIDAGVAWLWEVEGRVVHLTGINPPSFGVRRIGPVFTPAEERGRGWAAVAVAELATRTLAAGERCCLFTDRSNPVSNGLYARLGFEPVTDYEEVWLVGDDGLLDSTR